MPIRHSLVTRLLATSVLIAINWGTYIWGVYNDRVVEGGIGDVPRALPTADRGQLESGCDLLEAEIGRVGQLPIRRACHPADRSAVHLHDAVAGICHFARIWMQQGYFAVGDEAVMELFFVIKRIGQP